MAEKNDRELLFNKFDELGISGLSEREMLELLLFSMIPSRNVNSAALRLIEKYGSLKNVLFAPAAELEEIEGVGKNAALQLRLIGAVTDHSNRAQPSTKEEFTDHDKIENFFIEHFKIQNNESLTLLLLDDKSKMLTVHSISNSKPNHIIATNREIIGPIIEYDCRKMVIAHNHLNGISVPSDNDLKRTREIGELLRKIEVELVDHIIVCNGKAISLRKCGYLK